MLFTIFGVITVFLHRRRYSYKKINSADLLMNDLNRHNIIIISSDSYNIYKTWHDIISYINKKNNDFNIISEWIDVFKLDNELKVIIKSFNDKCQQQSLGAVITNLPLNTTYLELRNEVVLRGDDYDRQYFNYDFSNLPPTLKNIKFLVKNTIFSVMTTILYNKKNYQHIMYMPTNLKLPLNCEIDVSDFSVIIIP